MIVYLAARYSRNEEMRRIRDGLESMGHLVTSRWIDCHAGKFLSSFTTEQLNDDPEYCATIAQKDLEDINVADVVILVGSREHVFHTLPEKQCFQNWDELVTSLQKEVA